MIRRRLLPTNLTGRVARKKPHLTIARKRRRLDFAKKNTTTGVKRNGNVFFGLTNLHSLFLENVEQDASITAPVWRERSHNISGRQ